MSFDVRRCQTNALNVRSLRSGDKRLLAGLDALCFPQDEPYPIAGRWWWVIEDINWNPVAYAGLARCPETPGHMFLCRSGTLPTHRRKGFAHRLTLARLEFASTRCESVITYVDRANVASGNNLIKAGMKLCVPTYRYGGDEAIYFAKDFA